MWRLSAIDFQTHVLSPTELLQPIKQRSIEILGSVLMIGPMGLYVKHEMEVGNPDT